MSHFQEQRAKAQAGKLVPGAGRDDGARSPASALPQAVAGGAPRKSVSQTITSKDISRETPNFQEKYGAHREKIRKIIPGWGRP